MVKSCAAIGCKKRHGSGESFNRFPSSKFRQKQWLASMKLLKPTCPEVCICMFRPLH